MPLYYGKIHAGCMVQLKFYRNFVIEVKEIEDSFEVN